MSRCESCGKTDFFKQIFVMKNNTKHIGGECINCGYYQLLPRTKENWLEAKKNGVRYSKAYKERNYIPPRSQLKLFA